MFVPDGGSYFSRFVVKFLEIFAAGLATAVSGYLIAHLSGAYSSSAPVSAPQPVGTIIQAAPAATVSGGPPAQPTPVAADANEQRTAPQPQQEADPPVVAQPQHETAAATKADANEPRPAPQQETGASAVAQPQHETAAATKAASSRKHVETDTSATDNKRDQESALARARAALANSETKRTRPPDPPPRQANAPRAPAAIGPQSRQADDRLGAASVAAAPANSASSPPSPMTQPPAELTPLAPVEIESRPVAPLETEPAPVAQEDTGVLSTLERFRHDPLAATDDAPRPPMPVGQ